MEENGRNVSIELLIPTASTLSTYSNMYNIPNFVYQSNANRCTKLKISMTIVTIANHDFGDLHEFSVKASEFQNSDTRLLISAI